MGFDVVRGDQALQETIKRGADLSFTTTNSSECGIFLSLGFKRYIHNGSGTYLVLGPGVLRESIL